MRERVSRLQRIIHDFKADAFVDIDGTKANADDDCLGEESIEEISDYLLAKEIVEEKLDELEEV